MPTIAVYAIAKNEAKHVDRWYESVKDADGVFVLDTGSEDNTIELLEKNGVTVYTATFEPFRFDLARNCVLNIINSKFPAFDYGMFIDLDEVMEDDWYEKLQASLDENPDATAVNFRMVYDVSAGGAPATTYNRLMVHSIKDYTWAYPVHEVLICDSGVPEKEIYTDIRVRHLPDLTKSRDSYLNLLELGVWIHPNDPRPAIYLGREYARLGRCDDALDILRQHIEHETNRWIRSESYRLMADCYEAKGDTLEARDCHTLSCAEAPDIRESWGDAAAFYFRVQRYHGAIGCIDNMFDVAESPEHTIIRNDAYYNEWPFHMAAVCYDRLCMHELAQSNIVKAFNMSPQDPYILADMAKLCDLKIEEIDDK